jgi:hypothetical protein
MPMSADLTTRLGPAMAATIPLRPSMPIELVS